jgi:iron complex transport system ATP-binding protein
MSACAIGIEDLCVFGSRRVVLTMERLRVDDGALVAVMGPNGAGKSTFLRCLLGLQSRVSGRVRVFGNEVNALGWSALARLRSRIGYVPQLLPGRSEVPLTVREVVAMGRTARAGLFRRLSKEDWNVVDYWLERLGLKALARAAYGEISGGEQRKTLLARAMVQEPRLLLLDEPTANLDLGWRERLVTEIQALHDTLRLTTVLVCHELEVLPTGCRLVFLLHEGRLVSFGSPEQVFTASMIARLYGPGLEAVHRGDRHAVVPVAQRVESHAPVSRHTVTKPEPESGSWT